MPGTNAYDIKQLPLVEPHGVSTGQVRLRMPNVSWETPGSFLADRLTDCEAVLSIYERVEPDRYALFVILSQDSDEVLNAVFESEQELFRAFNDMTFDLRVMRPGESWDPAALRASATAHLERE